MNLQKWSKVKGLRDSFGIGVHPSHFFFVFWKAYNILSLIDIDTSAEKVKDNGSFSN